MPEDLRKLNISPEFHGFLNNLSMRAEDEDRIPFIGREKEIEAVMESLLRKLKNSILLIGKPGVGKTALITEIASRINRDLVPRGLKSKIILELSMNAFLYSRKTTEILIKDFERLFAEIKKNQDKIIFFLDEMQLQSVVGTDKKDEYRHIQNLLKSHISNRTLSIIAATTPENYFKYIKNDELLSLSFSTVFINEPSEKEMMFILMGIKSYFENYYAIRIPESVFETIYYLAQKFIPHRAFPHKAVDLLDMACSKSTLKGRNELNENFIYSSVSDISKLRLGIVKLDPVKHYRGITEYLNRNVVNQKEAISEISRIIKLARLETDTDGIKPEGIFLFLGATGVGKSYVAQKIAEYLFGSENKLRVIDLKQYQNPSDIKKLMGDSASSPGELVQEVENHPFSVILFENIGLAHSLVLAFLGKVLRKGYIIDSFGKKYHFSNIIIILNLTRIGEERKGKKIGFVKPDKTSTTLVIPQKIMNVLDWVDEIIEFVPLSKKHLSEVAKEKLSQVVAEIHNKHHTDIRIHDDVFNYIASRALKEGHFAHSVGRIIEREFRIRILDLVSKGENTLRVNIDGTSKKPDIKPAHKE